MAHRSGENHQRATLSDIDVAQIRELREVYRLTYKVIADKFEANRHTVASICN